MRLIICIFSYVSLFIVLIGYRKCILLVFNDISLSLYLFVRGEYRISNDPFKIRMYSARVEHAIAKVDDPGTLLSGKHSSLLHSSLPSTFSLVEFVVVLRTIKRIERHGTGGAGRY